MQTHAARLDSFKPAPRKRNQPKNLPSWPHPSTYGVTPATLADAGYYYDPQPGSAPDNVNCIYCENGLQDWEEEDDALDEHCRDITKGPRAGTRCPYAIVKKAIRDYQTLGEKACEDPGSERMLLARKGTFGRWWTFDSKPGWNPTSDRLAAAGFYNCPTQEAADICACLYCPAELDGWEAEDDPDYEHRKRAPDCFFYTSQAKATSSRSKGKGRKQEVKASVAAPVAAGVVEAPTKAAKGKKKGVKRSATQESLAASESQDVSRSVENEVVQPPKQKTSAKGKGAAVRKSKASTVRITSTIESESEDPDQRSSQQPIPEESEAEELAVKRSTRASRAGVVAPAQSTRTAKTRSKASQANEAAQASVSQSEADAESEAHGSDTQEKPDIAPLPSKARRATKTGTGKAAISEPANASANVIDANPPKAKSKSKAPARKTATRKGTKTGSRSRTASIATLDDKSMSETASVADSQTEAEEAASATDDNNENVPTPKAITSYHSSKALANGATKASSKSTSSRSKSKKASTSSIQPSRRVTRARSGSQSSVMSFVSSAALSDDGIPESEAEAEEGEEDGSQQRKTAQPVKAKGKTGRKGKAKADESIATEAETTGLSTLEDVQETEELETLAKPAPNVTGTIAASVGNPIDPSAPARKVKSLPKRVSSPYTQPDTSQKPTAAAPVLSNPPSITHPSDPPSRPSIYASIRPTASKPQASRSQSALDALLAGPMPTFDSPEKRASSSIADNETPDSSLTESENATPEPSSHNPPSLLDLHPTLKLDPLTPEEAQMPLSAWMKLVCDREVDKFQQTGKAYLDAWDRQVAAHRAELLRNIS